MDVERFRDYCLGKKGVTEGFPFGGDVLVFKVMDKMFALISLSANPFTVNPKMDSDLVDAYREKYADVQPGYHMNKKHWNTICFDSGMIPNAELLWFIDHSYEQVVNGLSKKVQLQLNEL